ncbi:MAG TPA: hypothetical protein V6D05_09250 [Stenomitos sp.]
MGLDDDLLSCLALERQAHALYTQWGSSVGHGGTLTEMLSRLADQSDRHRASLWDLALRHDVTPPPRHELDLDPRGAYIEHAKATLRRAIAELSALAEDLEPYSRSLVERMRNEDEAQLRQLLILSPEPALSTTLGHERREPKLHSSEPRWRPGMG